MIESFLVTSRETLEASLVVGIVLAYLNKTNNQQYRKSVYYGIIFGIIGSVITALLFTIFAGEFEGPAEQIFEGVTMIIGAFLLTTMILWMLQQRHIAKEIESKVNVQLQRAEPFMSHLGILLLVGIAILREGVETVIFLNAANYASGVSFVGGLLGVLAAILVGYIFFMSVTKVNLTRVFNVTSILLVMFAAGLVGHSVHEFEEAGLVPAMVEHVYDLSPIVSEEGIVGGFIKGLFGYTPNPSLSETLAYLAYLAIIFMLYRNIEQTRLAASLPASRKH